MRSLLRNVLTGENVIWAIIILGWPALLLFASLLASAIGLEAAINSSPRVNRPLVGPQPFRPTASPSDFDLAGHVVFVGLLAFSVTILCLVRPGFIATIDWSGLMKLLSGQGVEN
jgi:hypothetical protein